VAIAYDRLKAGIVSLVRSATSRLAYAAPRFAKVVKGAADGSTLDVVPEDPAFPAMGGVPLFHGLPGIKLQLAAGTRVLVEFSEADPARPFVRSWAGGESVTSMTISATALNLGGDGATPPALATLVNLALKLIETHTHPVSGTLAGPSPALAALPPDVSAAQARVL
jgi:hypothetical protein